MNAELNKVPRRFLIEYHGQKFIMNGYGDPLAAAESFAHGRGNMHGETVQVTELITPTLEVVITTSVKAEYR